MLARYRESGSPLLSGYLIGERNLTGERRRSMSGSMPATSSCSDSGRSGAASRSAPSRCCSTRHCWRGSLYLREVDEASLRVRADQAHAHAVADVEPLDSALEPPFHRHAREPDPRALRSGAGDDCVELLPDAIGEPERCSGFFRQPLDLVGRILLTRAVLRERRQLGKRVGAGCSRRSRPSAAAA